MEQTIDNQVAIIENSVEVFKQGPAILVAHRDRSNKALIIGRNILQSIADNGGVMTAEIDQRANNYLANANKALKEMKEGRAEVTQIMDELKKMFTTVENELDCKKAGTVPAQIQAHRDAYVKQVAEEQRKKQEEAEKAAAKSREEVEIRSFVNKWISEKLIELLAAKKQAVNAAFNAITLQNFEEKAAALKVMVCTIEPSILLEKIGTLTSFPSTRHLELTEIEAIRNATIEQFNFIEWIDANWQNDLGNLKQDLIDKLPSKLNELKEQKRLADEAEAARIKAEQEEKERQAAMAKANEEEKIRLQKEAVVAQQKEKERLEALEKQRQEAEAEQKKREEEEQKRIEDEAAESKRKAEEAEELRKEGEKTMILFDKEAAVATDGNAPESRQGYEINVLHPAGYVQIFQLWFENEGKNLPVNKIGNTKLDQMKNWAEKHAHKNDVKIESKFLQYEPSYKAVNRKTVVK
jgi:hypothetical protein